MRRAVRTVLIIGAILLAALGGHAGLMTLSATGTGSLAGLAASTCSFCHR